MDYKVAPVFLLCVFLLAACSGKNDDTGRSNFSTKLPISISDYDFSLKSNSNYVLPEILKTAEGDKAIFWRVTTGNGIVLQYAVYDPELDVWSEERSAQEMFLFGGSGFSPHVFQVVAGKNNFAIKGQDYRGNVNVTILQKGLSGWTLLSPSLISERTSGSDLRSDGNTFMLAVGTLNRGEVSVFQYKNNDWEKTFLKTGAVYINLFALKQGYGLAWAKTDPSNPSNNMIETLNWSTYNGQQWQAEMPISPFVAEVGLGRARVQLQFAASKTGYCLSRISENNGTNLYAQTFEYDLGWQPELHLNDFSPNSSIRSFQTVQRDKQCAVAWSDSSQARNRLYVRNYDNVWLKQKELNVGFTFAYKLSSNDSQIGIMWTSEDVRGVTSFSKYDTAWTDYPITSNFTNFRLLPARNEFLQLSLDGINIVYRKFSQDFWGAPLAIFTDNKKPVSVSPPFSNLEIGATFLPQLSSLVETTKTFFSYPDAKIPGIHLTEFDEFAESTQTLSKNLVNASSVAPKLAMNKMGQILLIWQQYDSNQSMQIYGSLYNKGKWSKPRLIKVKYGALTPLGARLELQALDDDFVLLIDYTCYSISSDWGSITISAENWAQAEVPITTVGNERSKLVLRDGGLTFCWLDGYFDSANDPQAIYCTSYESGVWTAAIEPIYTNIDAKIISSINIDAKITSLKTAYGFAEDLMVWQEEERTGGKFLVVAKKESNQWKIFRQEFPGSSLSGFTISKSDSSPDKLMVVWQESNTDFTIDETMWTQFDLIKEQWSMPVNAGKTQTLHWTKLVNFKQKSLLFSWFNGRISAYTFNEKQNSMSAGTLLIPWLPALAKYGILEIDNKLMLYWDNVRRDYFESDPGTVAYRLFDGESWSDTYIVKDSKGTMQAHPDVIAYKGTPVMAYSNRISKIHSEIGLKTNW